MTLKYHRISKIINGIKVIDKKTLTILVFLKNSPKFIHMGRKIVSSKIGCDSVGI